MSSTVEENRAYMSRRIFNRHKWEWIQHQKLIGDRDGAQYSDKADNIEVYGVNKKTNIPGHLDEMLGARLAPAFHHGDWVECVIIMSTLYQEYHGAIARDLAKDPSSFWCHGLKGKDEQILEYFELDTIGKLAEFNLDDLFSRVVGYCGISKVGMEAIRKGVAGYKKFVSGIDTRQELCFNEGMDEGHGGNDA